MKSGSGRRQGGRKSSEARGAKKTTRRARAEAAGTDAQAKKGPRAAAPDKQASKALVKRGRDELPFLASRKRSTPLDAATLRAHIEHLRSRGASLKAHIGRESHELGTLLILLYMRHCDAVLGYANFNALLADVCAGRVEDGKGLMFVARHCTRAQAEAHGYWKCFYGIRLQRKLGLPTFGALEKHDFGPDADGNPITFDSLLVTQVQAMSESPKLAEPGADGAAGRALIQVRERTRELHAKNPRYRALNSRSFVRDGKVATTLTATGRDGAELAKRFLEELWK